MAQPETRQGTEPQERLYHGQAYVAVSREPYTRRDGSTTELVVWESLCARCGEPFTFKTPTGASKWQPNRRCHEHRRPGSEP